MAEVREIITDANCSALNAALQNHMVNPDMILAIHYVETNSGAGIGLINKQYRVLYYKETP